MRRLRRILLNAATTLSLLLCAAAALLWVSSYYVSDEVTWVSQAYRGGVVERRAWTILIDTGLLRVERAELTHQGPEFLVGPDVRDGARWDWDRSSTERPRPSGGRLWNRLGFGYDVVNQTYGAGLSVAKAVAYVPCWVIVLGTAALPAVRCSRWRRTRHRRTSGLCPACGYDLRATPDSCPECGTTAAAPTPQ